MAAILEPHRFPRPTTPARPDLRLIPGGRAARPTPARPAPLVVAVALVGVVLLVVATLAVGRGALAGLAPAPATAGVSATSGAASGGTVVVAPGDTLWSIARRLQPSGDVRPLVDQLAAMNGGAAIAAGDRLVVPT